jgi:hypothetical protein
MVSCQTDSIANTITTTHPFDHTLAQLTGLPTQDQACK